MFASQPSRQTGNIILRHIMPTALFALTIAAYAIGLAILVIYFRGRGSIAVDDINRMKG